MRRRRTLNINTTHTHMRVYCLIYRLGFAMRKIELSHKIYIKKCINLNQILIKLFFKLNFNFQFFFVCICGWQLYSARAQIVNIIVYETYACACCLIICLPSRARALSIELLGCNFFLLTDEICDAVAAAECLRFGVKFN